MPDYNILFLFTDEQRADTMAAYGNDRIQTPVLNRLSESCTVFDNCYVTQAVCTPSRASIMTGLYPHTHTCTANNIPLPADVPCLPEMLPAGKYACGYHGKWHLGDEIYAQRGFDDWESIEDGYCGYYSPHRDQADRSTYHHWLTGKGLSPAKGDRFGRGEATRLDEALGKPAFLAEMASRFIREHQRNPWALYVNFLEPHMPFYGPRDNQHDPADVTLPANFNDLPKADQPLKTRLYQQWYYDHGHSGLPLKTEADWRRMIANYWGLCSLVDTHVGAILATLDDCGLMDNTIVVYTSDHGDMMGSHRLLAKCTQFEEAVRVPLLVRLPGQQTPRRIAGRVSQTDLIPTLLDMAGQSAPDHLEGRSLRHELETGDASADDVVIEWNGTNTGCITSESPAAGTKDERTASLADPVRTVITADGWKLNCSTIGEHELYDLNTDPLETTNLACRDDATGRMRQLRDRIIQWQQRTDDTVALPKL